ncbi:SAM-dependent methyltransferase [Usitatibacter palustris]|uniref:Cyclopropane-fatty-acyl-phospholipid synthase n=1 Tax=Usitatibacter palustris TaxID=2732487 RepID=A0A6M4H2G8_9PROT|nr:cyclopropane-fatty-acyl-phospholipid synthase family protein [Usitatibacter palustris]QJR13739.1 Cyclopropane-fatty-acyl-phospholipid synthase [Usitatibacter palustris]
MNASSRVLDWVEQGFVPDTVIRSGIRRLCEARLKELRADEIELASEAIEKFVRQMSRAAVAPVPHLANQQHYEVPPAFFALVLGPHRKYSSAWWPAGIDSLHDAEAAALAATCERAGLADGQDILELGCGWGSLTLWMARHYPRSRVTAVSNSGPQRDYILGEARRRGFANVEVLTADMNTFAASRSYDRIVSVEMFEHMRNWRELFARVHDWLRPGGRFFMHVFCHRSVPYAFIDAGPSDWMSRHFFSGGMMPSDELALHFQEDLRCIRRWRWDGTHYRRTANAWLANLDARREQALAVLAATYGEDAAQQWLQRWRIFFMACAEMFGYREGREWWVSHHLFERPVR